MGQQQNSKKPPTWSLKFFHWFCDPDCVEDIEGDLLERFDKRLHVNKPARWLFVMDIIRLFRPGIIKEFKISQKLNTYGMYRNYLKIGFRNLLRNKSNGFINLGGLTIGLIVFMLIYLWIVDEFSYNKHHQSYDRIAKVLRKRTLNGEVGVRFALPIPLVDELRTTYSDHFKYVTVTGWQGPLLVDTKEKQIHLVGNYMSANAPKLLDLQMISGTQDALKDKFSVILSENAAKSLYGNDDPLGQVIDLDGEVSMVVSGVYANIPDNSSFQELSVIGNFEGYSSSQEWIERAKDNANWETNFCQVFVQLTENASIEAVNDRIAHVIYDHVSEQVKEIDPKAFLHPMADWHLKNSWKNGLQSGGRIQYVWLFGGIGIFVLLLACINFINLSTAQAEKRAKEVGIRKSLGSLRTQLVSQFLVESGLVVLLAFIIAVAITYLILPFFNELSDKQIEFPIGEYLLWFQALIFLGVLSFVAAFYPAIYLSKFEPVKVLKGRLSIDRSTPTLRRALVVFQFVISTTLITGTIIIHEQISFSKDRSVGYDPTNLLSIRSSATAFKGKHTILRDELLKTGAVQSVSQSSSPLTEVNRTSGGFDWGEKDPSLSTNFVFSYVTPEYGNTIGWEIQKGRDFTEKVTDQQAFIFNKAAIDFMGLENPIGENVSWRGQTYHIIGVVQDLILESPFQQTRPAVYAVDESKGEWMQIKLKSDVTISESIRQVERVFDKVLPNIPFEFDFSSQQYDRKFSTVEQVGSLSRIFTVLAIIISALGIFGLVSFMAERRTKEIGIRKVLGASFQSLILLLSTELGVLVLVASVLAVPISYLLGQQWLDDYAYRIKLEWYYFLIASILALIISLGTIAKKAIQSAIANPVKSLRDE